MTAPKFTPGPWGAQWSKYRDGEFIVQASHPTYRVLARFDGDGVSDVPDEQSIANAHLIAAAPELYEALRELTDDIADRFDMGSPSTNPWMKSAVQAARAALAKARGEG